MAPGFPIRISDFNIRTSEALYQACRFPHKPDIQNVIIKEASPMTAKMKSKPYRKDSRVDWDEIRVPVMKWCLRVKLAQNWASFGELLLSTGDKPIVEDTQKDDFWGAIKNERGEFHGKNVLGRLLMELREKLKNDPETLRYVEPVNLENFCLLGSEIPAITALEPKRPTTRRSFSAEETLQLWDRY